MKCHVSQGLGIQWVSKADPAPARLRLGVVASNPTFLQGEMSSAQRGQQCCGTLKVPRCTGTLKRKRLVFLVCAYFLQTHWTTHTHKPRPSDLQPEWWQNRPNLPVNRSTRNLSNQTCSNSGRIWGSPNISVLGPQKPQPGKGGWILRSFKDSESVNSVETQCLTPSERGLLLWTRPKN